jgi:hypothetical protein
VAGAEVLISRREYPEEGGAAGTAVSTPVVGDDGVGGTLTGAPTSGKERIATGNAGAILKGDVAGSLEK